MKNYQPFRIIWIFALGFLIVTSTGCATYNRIAFDSRGGGEVPTISETSLVEGTSVRATLKSGETFVGRVVAVSNRELVINGLGNYGESDITLVASEIDYVEVRDQSDGQIEGRWFILLGVAAVTAFFMTSWGLN